MLYQFFTSRNRNGELELITEFGSGRSYATISGDKPVTLLFKDGHLVAVRRDYLKAKKLESIPMIEINIGGVQLPQSGQN